MHWCHHFFQDVVRMPRRRRSTAPYRINEWVFDRLSRLAEKCSYRPNRTGVLIPVSAGVARELVAYFPRMRDRIRVIPNGVDSQRFRPDVAARREVRARHGLEQDDLIAVFLGGDWDRKGLALAVRSLRHAPAWRLVVVGDGDIGRFSTLAEAEGVEDRVVFAGKRSDPEAYLAAADAFVFPTAYEAFPLAALEAASSGLPILAPRVSGIDELVDDGTNGYLINHEPSDIGCRLQELQDPVRRRTMGEAARRTIEPYTWDVVTDHYIALYRDFDSRFDASHGG